MQNLLTLIEYVFLNIMCLIAAYKDCKTYKIPNWIPLVLFLAWLVFKILEIFLVVFLQTDTNTFEILANCATSVLSSAFIVCVLAGITVVVNKKNGHTILNNSSFGMGDIKLILSASLYLNFTYSIVALFVSCLCFVLYFVFKKLKDKKQANRLPFAPFFFIGVLLSSAVLFCG